MKIVNGRKILWELEEIVDPVHTALLVWDMQNDTLKRLADPGTLIRNVHSVLSAARKTATVRLFSQHTNMALADESDARLRFLGRLYSIDIDDLSRQHTGYVRGTPGWQIAEELTPVAGEIVFEKHRPCAFIGTSFELLLKAHSVKTILLTGIATEFGIEFTARYASALGYYPVVLSDCVSSWRPEFHETSLRFMKLMCDVVDSRALLKMWAP